MPSTTRRRALHGAVALLAGAAGCSGERSSGSGYPPESVENVAFDPPSHSLRHPDREPVVWTGERPTPEADDEPRVDVSHRVLVADAATASDISFADVDGAGAARAFLDATDYDAETVYVE